MKNDRIDKPIALLMAVLTLVCVAVASANWANAEHTDLDVRITANSSDIEADRKAGVQHRESQMRFYDIIEKKVSSIEQLMLEQLILDRDED